MGKGKKFASTLTNTNAFHAISILFDIVAIVYFFLSIYWWNEPIVPFELALGTYFLVEYTLLFISSNDKTAYLSHPLSISNILIIIGYLAAPFHNLGFLRVLRILRIIQLYQIIPDIRMITKRVMRWEKLLISLSHLIVLIVIITEFVYVLQRDTNEYINTPLDALDFTISSITNVSTGSETVQLVGSTGQVLAILIALISLSLFLQLIDSLRRLQHRQQRKCDVCDDTMSNHTHDEKKICTFCDIKNRK